MRCQALAVFVLLLRRLLSIETAHPSIWAGTYPGPSHPLGAPGSTLALHTWRFHGLLVGLCLLFRVFHREVTLEAFFSPQTCGRPSGDSVSCSAGGHSSWCWYLSNPAGAGSQPLSCGL